MHYNIAYMIMLQIIKNISPKTSVENMYARTGHSNSKYNMKKQSF